LITFGGSAIWCLGGWAGLDPRCWLQGTLWGLCSSMHRLFLQQQLRRIQLCNVCLPLPLDPVAATAAAAAIRELVQRLRAVGAAAGAIPVGSFCNNSGCVNVCGPSEVMLVSGRTNLCAGCRTARYCGRGCQGQAWKQHKPVCKALAAAAAAAAAGAHDAEGAGAAT
jgi:hypothetical protein